MTPNNLEWQYIPGYEGLYGITRNGDVWGEKRKTVQAGWRKQTNNWRGYNTIALRKNGSVKNCMVSRLVAATYIPNPEDKPQVNHINGTKTDNRVENLEWVTQAENQQHARRAGLHKNQAKGSRHGNAKLTESQVLEMRQLFKDGGYTRLELSRKYGVHSLTARDILSGKEWSWLK